MALFEYSWNLMGNVVLTNDLFKYLGLPETKIQ